jgi:hypothetical protein
MSDLEGIDEMELPSINPHLPVTSIGSDQKKHAPQFLRHGQATESTAHSKAGPLLLAVLLIAQLMVILDITAVNIALPSLATDLKLSGSTVSWTITSYSLIFGSLLLFGGRAADLVGRRRLFMTGLGVFTASSFASALAGTARSESPSSRQSQRGLPEHSVARRRHQVSRTPSWQPGS